MILPLATNTSQTQANSCVTELEPLSELFSNNFRLHIDGAEHRGPHIFINGHLTTTNLDEHYQVLTQGEASSRPHNSYDEKYVDLYERNGSDKLLQFLQLTYAEVQYRKKLNEKYIYNKGSGVSNNSTYEVTSENNLEMNHIKKLKNFKKSLGFDPIYDYFQGKYSTFDVRYKFGVGDYIVTDKSSKVIAVIETKNTFMAIGSNFINAMDRAYDKARDLGAVYYLLIAWPEDDQLAENEINKLLRYSDFTKAYNRWKNTSSKDFICKKIKMPNHVFLAPQHHQFDPISLYRERMLRMANAITEKCNSIALGYSRKCVDFSIDDIFS